MKPLMGALAFSLSAAAGLAQSVNVGAPLTPWTPGTLDIHQIATGDYRYFLIPGNCKQAGDANTAIPPISYRERPSRWRGTAALTITFCPRNCASIR